MGRSARNVESSDARSSWGNRLRAEPYVRGYRRITNRRGDISFSILFQRLFYDGCRKRKKIAIKLRGVRGWPSPQSLTHVSGRLRYLPPEGDAARRFFARAHQPPRVRAESVSPNLNEWAMKITSHRKFPPLRLEFSNGDVYLTTWAVFLSGIRYCENWASAESSSRGSVTSRARY